MTCGKETTSTPLPCPALQDSDGGPDVVDFQTEDRGRCAALQQKPDAVEIEEQQPWRVIDRRRLHPEQLRVERRGTLEVMCALGHLDQSQSASRLISYGLVPAIIRNPATRSNSKAGIGT
jgi:hypothetical protein